MSYVPILVPDVYARQGQTFTTASSPWPYAGSAYTVQYLDAPHGATRWYMGAITINGSGGGSYNAAFGLPDNLASLLRLYNRVTWLSQTTGGHTSNNGASISNNAETFYLAATNNTSSGFSIAPSSIQVGGQTFPGSNQVGTKYMYSEVVFELQDNLTTVRCYGFIGTRIVVDTYVDISSLETIARVVLVAIPGGGGSGQRILPVPFVLGGGTVGTSLTASGQLSLSHIELLTGTSDTWTPSAGNLVSAVQKTNTTTIDPNIEAESGTVTYTTNANAITNDIIVATATVAGRNSATPMVRNITLAAEGSNLINGTIDAASQQALITNPAAEQGIITGDLTSITLTTELVT